MKRMWVAVIGLIMVVSMIHFAFAEQPLIIYYFPRPPMHYANSDGTVGGFLAEIVKLVLNDAGVKYEFRDIPAKRILDNLKEKEISCGIGWFKNPDREKFATFSEPIYQDLPSTIVINKEKVVELPANPTMEQLLTSKLILSVKDGFSYGAWADEAIKKYGPKTEVTSGEQDKILQKITIGRGDYTFMGVEEASWLLPKDPDFAAKLVIIKISDAPAGNMRYILFSKAVEQAVVDKVNQSIAKVIKSEAYRKLTTFPNQGNK